MRWGHPAARARRRSCSWTSETDAAVDYICECAVTARARWRDALRIHDYCKGASERFMTPDAGARGRRCRPRSIITLCIRHQLRACARIPPCASCMGLGLSCMQ